MVAGGDGDDFEHRQRVAAHYRVRFVLYFIVIYMTIYQSMQKMVPRIIHLVTGNFGILPDLRLILFPSIHLFFVQITSLASRASHKNVTNNDIPLPN